MSHVKVLVLQQLAVLGETISSENLSMSNLHFTYTLFGITDLCERVTARSVCVKCQIYVDLYWPFFFQFSLRNLTKITSHLWKTSSCHTSIQGHKIPFGHSTKHSTKLQHTLKRRWPRVKVTLANYSSWKLPTSTYFDASADQLNLAFYLFILTLQSTQYIPTPRKQKEKYLICHNVIIRSTNLVIHYPTLSWFSWVFFYLRMRKFIFYFRSYVFCQVWINYLISVTYE